MRIARTLARTVLLLVVISGGLVTVLILTNPAPDVSPADTRDTARPYVIKLHARWCVVCMVTKDEWADVERAYAAKANLLVFDFTTDTTTAASRARARELGLEGVFDEFDGTTGLVLVVEGRTKNVRHVLDGSRELAEYRAAIDDVLLSPIRQ